MITPPYLPPNCTFPDCRPRVAAIGIDGDLTPLFPDIDPESDFPIWQLSMRQVRPAILVEPEHGGCLSAERP